MRNIPIWIIAAFPVTVQGITHFYQEAHSHVDGVRRFKIAYKVFSTILVSMFVLQAGIFLYGAYVLHEVSMVYPTQAVQYLHAHMPKERIFSTYDWGGYLLWKLPEKKDYIDGRMPSWRWHANIKGESNYAFNEYKKVMTGKELFSFFTAKYHISTLLVPKAAAAKPPTKFLGFTISKNPLLKQLFFSLSSFYGVVVQAKQLGWKEVYHDNIAIIYQKQPTP